MKATAKLSLSYIAPGNSGATTNLSASIDYVGSSAGFLDIPEGTADGASFSVPFGSVSEVKAVAIQNNTALAKEISINASEDVFELAPGAMFVVAGPDASGITSLSVIETAAAGADGQVSYVVLGDSETP